MGCTGELHLTPGLQRDAGACTRQGDGSVLLVDRLPAFTSGQLGEDPPNAIWLVVAHRASVRTHDCPLEFASDSPTALGRTIGGEPLDQSFPGQPLTAHGPCHIRWATLARCSGYDVCLEIPMRYIFLLLSTACTPHLVSGEERVSGATWEAPENRWGVNTPPADLKGQGYAVGQVPHDFRLVD